MSTESERQSRTTDLLLAAVALLLLAALGTTLYLSAVGPSKTTMAEPPPRMRPIIKDDPRAVIVTREVAGARPAEAPKEESKPEPAKPVAAPVPVAVVAAAPSVTPNSDGKVRGRVVLKGAPPAERAIAAAKADPNCGKSYPDAGPSTRNYLVGAEGGLRNVLVRILSAPAGAGTPASQLNIEQKGCMYEPYLAGVLAGQPFKVRNSDGFLHNVLATCKNNAGFNFGQVGGQENEKTFAKPEVFVKLQCSVHPWMFSYLAVLENPFFAVTDDAGRFTLPDGLPPGKYTLEAQHLKAGIVTAELEVGAGKGADVEIQFAVK